MVCDPGRWLRIRPTLVFAGPVVDRHAKEVLREDWGRDAFYTVDDGSLFDLFGSLLLHSLQASETED